MNLKFIDFLNKANSRNWIKKGTENEEQIKVITYLEEKNYKFTSIPNSTYTRSIKQKIMNYVLGLRPGLPDILVILKTKKLLFIEMKRSKGKRGGLNGSKISQEQKEWIEEINKIKGVEAIVCHGGDEAVEKIEYFNNL